MAPAASHGAGLLDSHQITCRALSQESSLFSVIHKKEVWGRIPESHTGWKWLRERDKKHVLFVAKQPQQGKSWPGPRGQDREEMADNVGP